MNKLINIEIDYGILSILIVLKVTAIIFRTDIETFWNIIVGLYLIAINPPLW